MKYLLKDVIFERQSGQKVEMGDIEIDEHENIFFYKTDEGKWTFKIYDSRNWSSVTLHKDKASAIPTMRVTYHDQSEEE